MIKEQLRGGATIYRIYENKYFNNLLLNLIKVRNCENTTLESQEFYISLNRTCKLNDNPSITFKVMLYLCSLLTDSGLNENTFIITIKDMQDKIGISNAIYLDTSLNYLSSVSYDYKYHSNWQTCNIIASYSHFKGYFKVIFDDDFITLLDRTKQFYQVPKSLLTSDIRYYKHSIFIANYILIHQRRNKRKQNENIIAIKELVKNSPLLPLYEELNKEQRQVARAIIKPFEANLNNACRLLNMSWQYADKIPTNYIEFMRAKILLDSRL